MLKRNGLNFLVTKQRGVALMIALVVLLVLSMIGISGMQGTILEERMAGNMYDRNLAFQAAEAALRAGEANALAGVNIDFDVEGAVAPAELQYDANWPGTAISYAIALAGLDTAPEYIIERQHALPPLEADQPLLAPLMLVSARGSGRNDNSVVVVQSIFKP